MKKIGEVCKILGVSKKTLRGYDEIGLLHPTAKNEADYWLYDDLAVMKLKAILMFVEVGFSRLEIKNIFEHPDTIIQSYNMLEDELIQKRNRLNGMIRAVGVLKMTVGLPKQTLKSIIYVLNRFGENMPQTAFAEKTNEMINRLSTGEVTNKESLDEENNGVAQGLMLLSAVGLMRNLDADSEAVQNFIKESYELMVVGTELEEIFETREEKVLGFQEIVESSLETEYFDGDFGEGATAFVKAAIDRFVCRALEMKAE